MLFVFLSLEPINEGGGMLLAGIVRVVPLSSAARASCKRLIILRMVSVASLFFFFGTPVVYTVHDSCTMVASKMT